MEIRRFEEADREAVLRITVEAFGEVSIFPLAEKKYGRFGDVSWQEMKVKQIEEDLAKCTEGAFVAVDGGTVVGFITAIPDEQTGVGWIHNLAVAPGNQGRGVGSGLIRHALEYFSETGMTHASIETLVGNEAGTHLYPKLGFQELSRQIFYLQELPPRE